MFARTRFVTDYPPTLSGTETGDQGHLTPHPFNQEGPRRPNVLRPYRSKEDRRSRDVTKVP